MKPWSEMPIPACFECCTAPVEPIQVKLMEGIKHAADMVARDTNDQRTRHVFMRELGKSPLSHFGWFYLLSVLLALRNPISGGAPAPASLNESPLGR